MVDHDHLSLHRPHFPFHWLFFVFLLRGIFSLPLGKVVGFGFVARGPLVFALNLSAYFVSHLVGPTDL